MLSSCLVPSRVCAVDARIAVHGRNPDEQDQEWGGDGWCWKRSLRHAPTLATARNDWAQCAQHMRSCGHQCVPDEVEIFHAWNWITMQLLLKWCRWILRSARHSSRSSIMIGIWASLCMCVCRWYISAVCLLVYTIFGLTRVQQNHDTEMLSATCHDLQVCLFCPSPADCSPAEARN